MTDYISRDAILAKCAYEQPWGAEAVIAMIEDFPAADVRELRKSKWFDGACVNCGFKPMLDYEYDTVYDDHNGYKWNFCPNCGADMREEQT